MGLFGGRFRGGAGGSGQVDRSLGRKRARKAMQGAMQETCRGEVEELQSRVFAMDDGMSRRFKAAGSGRYAAAAGWRSSTTQLRVPAVAS